MYLSLSLCIYIYIYICICIYVWANNNKRTVLFLLRMVFFLLCTVFFLPCTVFFLPRTVFFLLRKVFWNTYGNPGTGEQGFDPSAGIEKNIFQICETFINSGETSFKHRPRLHLYENLQKLDWHKGKGISIPLWGEYFIQVGVRGRAQPPIIFLIN